MQTTVEGALLHEALANEGIAFVNHNIPADLIDESVAAYALLTDSFGDPDMETMNKMIVNPDKLDILDYSQDKGKEWNKSRTNHPQFAKPGGYTNRSFQAKVLRHYDRPITDGKSGKLVQASEDHKEYYHFHVNGLAQVCKMHRDYDWGPVPSEVVYLHEKLAKVHAIARVAMASFYGQLDEFYPAITQDFAQPKDLLNSPIRLLFYHPGQGDLLAGGHFDKGLGTMQIAESHEGFRYCRPADNTESFKTDYESNPVENDSMWLAERNSSNEGIAFMAKGFVKDHVYPHGLIKPTWHDVLNVSKLNPDRQLHGKNCARWAIIFFTNSPNAGLSTKQDTHLLRAA